MSCSHRWEPYDIRAPEPCPSCGAARSYRRERCPDCEITRLEESLSGPAGALLARIGDLDYRLSKRFSISIKDVSAFVYRGLRVLDDERAKYEKEKRKNGPGG